MPKIFISYRRADSLKDAGRIYDRLAEHFGKANVFKDVDNIPFGSDFRGVIAEAVASCDVVLAIIGKSWLTVKDEDGNRRLDNPADFVRIELETGLAREDCLVVPVLVDNATVPGADHLPGSLRELAFKNAIPVRDDPDFHPDVTKIIRGLEQRYSGATQPKPGQQQQAQPPRFVVHDAISRFYTAYGARNWDEARTILTEIRASGQAPRIFDVDTLEQTIWDEIAREQAEQDYSIIRLMAQHDAPERVWTALQVFWETHPDYDPDSIADRVRPRVAPAATISPRAEGEGPGVRAILPAPFAWIEIPGGSGIMATDESDVTLTIPAARYWIAKYPVTNAQFARFIEAGGYRERKWWTEAGWKQRESDQWTEPRYWQDSQWNGAEQPVVGVSWFEAVAFCVWLSAQTGENIMLPTEAQWQYAAQGDDNREYPWGNEWDCQRCNNSVSPCKSKSTTPVTHYAGKGDSPFGVVDMAGNVWEWCLTDYYSGDNNISKSATHRVLRGGSWYYSNTGGFRCADRFRYVPRNWFSNRGFRLALS